MKNDLSPRAARITMALKTGDGDLAKYIIAQLKPADLRTLAYELASNIPLATFDTDVLTQVVTASSIALGTNPKEVLSRSRHQQALDARQVACYVGHTLGLTYSEIGRHIGRDHASVMNSVARVGENARLRRVADAIAIKLGHEREAS